MRVPMWLRRCASVHVLVLIAFGCLAVPAAAQPLDEPVQMALPLNTDSTVAPPVGKTTFRTDIRWFGSRESAPYGSMELGYGLYERVALLVRVGGSDWYTDRYPGGVIRRGGYDYELAAMCSPKSWGDIGIMLGVSHANTAAQNDTFPTMQLLAHKVVNDRLTLHGFVRTVLIHKNDLAGVGVGASYVVNDRLILVGDFVGLFNGKNTYSVATGRMARNHLWSLGGRWSTQVMDRNVEFEVGVTNVIARTTGLSLTPALGGSIGGYAGFTVRF